MHGYGDEVRERFLAFMSLELTAYCDESGMQNHDLILAGYLVPASEWIPVEKAWGAAVRKAGLTEFKMRDCHAGEREFKDRKDRLELRDTFLSIIDSANVDGFAVRIDLTTFDEVRKKLDRSIRPGYNKAYLHGFSALTQFMANLVIDRPREERIHFVFDENDQFRGRALHMFEAMKAMPEISYRSRLGGITFENSKLLTPIQAADTLAYRTHRDLLHAPPVKWATVQASAPRVHVALLSSQAIVNE